LPERREAAEIMSYSITWEPHGVYRRYLGNVTIAERLASFETICRDRRFDDLRYAITNYLDVGAYEITPEATAEIAALHIGPLRTNPHIAIAAVAVRSDIVAAIRDFLAHGFTTAPYRVFPTLEEARSWTDETCPRLAPPP
jgi:hypothetical protein